MRPPLAWEGWFPTAPARHRPPRAPGMRRHVGARERMLTHARSINAAQGWTALHSATSCGYPSVAKLLLTTGASAGQTTAQGRSPLHYAASKGCVDIIPDLVSHGADVNARDCTGATPLHRAASVGLTPVLRVLLDTPGVKLDVKDNYGQTPLSLACSGGHRVAALVLAGRGADVEVGHVCEGGQGVWECVVDLFVWGMFAEYCPLRSMDCPSPELACHIQAYYCS